MYYHDIINEIAEALIESNDSALVDIERRAAEMLLSDAEAQALKNLIEAAFVSLGNQVG